MWRVRWVSVVPWLDVGQRHTCPTELQQRGNSSRQRPATDHCGHRQTHDPWDIYTHTDTQYTQTDRHMTREICTHTQTHNIHRQTDTWPVRYIHTHRHTIYTDRQTHDPWHMWPQVAQTMTKLMLMFSSVLMLFTKQSTIFHDVLSHDKRYSARQLLKQLSFQALVLSITSLTTTSTSDKWFSVLATWLRSRWSLKFHISETRLYILMKLLHITLIKQ